MATITPTQETPARNVVVFTWANMANGDVGAPVLAPMLADVSVHAYGTEGAGFSLDIEGSNETGTPSNWADVNDPAANQLTFGASSLPGVGQVLENMHQYRPNVAGGDGTTDVTVKMMFHGNR